MCQHRPPQLRSTLAPGRLRAGTPFRFKHRALAKGPRAPHLDSAPSGGHQFFGRSALSCLLLGWWPDRHLLLRRASLRTRPFHVQHRPATLHTRHEGALTLRSLKPGPARRRAPGTAHARAKCTPTPRCAAFAACAARLTDLPHRPADPHSRSRRLRSNSGAAGHAGARQRAGAPLPGLCVALLCVVAATGALPAPRGRCSRPPRCALLAP